MKTSFITRVVDSFGEVMYLFDFEYEEGREKEEAKRLCEVYHICFAGMSLRTKKGKLCEVCGEAEAKKEACCEECFASLHDEPKDAK